MLEARRLSAIGKYSGARYTQHSTPVKDGREGLIEFFEDFHRRNPIRDIEIVRGFEDGQYEFLHWSRPSMTVSTAMSPPTSSTPTTMRR